MAYKYNRHSLLIDWMKKQKDLCENYQPSNRPIQRGAIFHCELGENIGNELSKSRPVLVISESSRNKKGNNVTVIPLLSAYHKLKNESLKQKYRQNKQYQFNPSDYYIRPTQFLLMKSQYGKLKNDSLVICESITTVSKARLSVKSTEKVNESTMREIEKRILNTFDMKGYSL